MEAEERPMKIRKMDHDANSPEVTLGNTTDSNSGVSAAQPVKNSSEDGISSAQDVETAGNKHSTNQSELSTLSDPSPAEAKDGATKLSKNQLKKLKRKEQWEAGREDRKVKRREKMKEKKERRREAYQQDPSLITALKAKNETKSSNRVVPVTVVLDCDFDDMMFEQELKSLGTQLTRSYSDNRHANFKTHLVVASFGGRLKERFDGLLAGQYKNWHGIKFLPDDFVAVAEKAKKWMRSPDGGTIAGALEKQNPPEGEVVYLSSESDVTLQELNPYSTYIIGGLVDHNRHKGICYKRAVARGVKTAKLPIGDFLEMESRKVLATNHVLEIMLKWLELGDWGEAFMQVIPKRKGGTLRGEAEDSPATRSSVDIGEERNEDSRNEQEAEQTIHGAEKQPAGSEEARRTDK